MSLLGKVSILIKTFLRDEYLYDTLTTIRREMPEAQLIVIDDGDMTHVKDNTYADLVFDGHCVDVVPFDSGFGFKSNRGVELCKRDYLLIGSDDFDFRGTRSGIEKMAAVLEGAPADIASGRVHNNPYEGWLDEPQPGIVRERYINHSLPPSCIFDANGKRVTYRPCELTVNFSLIRSSILGRDKIHWDDDVKIGGGEHGAFFLDVKHAGHLVVYVEGVNINEQDVKPMDSRYGSFRGRARNPQRPCFDRRGVKQYYCFGGYPDIAYGPKG